MISIDGLLEVSFVAWGNVSSLLALLTSILSGYLVVAFLAGKKMTRSQVVIVNGLYLFISSFCLWALMTMMRRAAIFEDIAYSMADGDLAALTSRGDVAGGLIFAFGIAMLASLKFMWDVRHSDAP